MTTVGIDLGTTNSSVAVVDGQGLVTVLKNASNEQVTPSVVTLLDGEVIVGRRAARQRITQAERTILGSKRLMGRRLRDPEAVTYAERAAFALDEDENGLVMCVGDYRVTPAQIAAYVLADLRATAETYLGQEVTSAVVTVPAFFDALAREATRFAASAAGFTDVRLLSEPTAAALAYGYKRLTDKTLAVYDLGGGTLDVSILRVDANSDFEVLATSGDAFLGGDDIDFALVELLATRFQARTRVNALSDRLAMQRLREEAETAKIDLSRYDTVDVQIPFIMDGAIPLHLRETLTRADLETAAQPLMQRLMAPCEDALHRAGLTVDQIDDVLLVGGQTRMPMIAAAVEQFFGRKARRDLDAELVVTQGAALYAGVLDNHLEKPKLSDITAHTLGVELADGGVWPLIPSGSPLGSHQEAVFTTSVDNQPSVLVRVIQGEAKRAGENRQLGDLRLDGVPPVPAGEADIDVMFHIDANGVLLVRAQDVATGVMKEIELAAL